jgi:hypothetical protein
MAFDVSGISAWTNELADRSEWILKPILGADTLQKLPGITKLQGIKGYTEKIPTFESTTPWQSGTACSFTTSGSTTITQLSFSTSPIQVAEQICLNDLDTYFAQQYVNKKGIDETFGLLDMWVNRKQAQTALQVESALWQSKTTYTNATHLKRINGWIATLDTAGTAIAATQQASISTSTVRGIIEEIAYSKIPSRIRNMNPVIVCGQDTFNIYRLKLMQDNLYHLDPTNTNMGAYTMNVYGTNVKLIGLVGLNNDNAVDTGSLPTAVKNRIFATYEANLVLGFNAANDVNDFDVWYSKDDRVLKYISRWYMGVGFLYPDLVVQYTNS